MKLRLWSSALLPERLLSKPGPAFNSLQHTFTAGIANSAVALFTSAFILDIKGQEVSEDLIYSQKKYPSYLHYQK